MEDVEAVRRGEPCGQRDFAAEAQALHHHVMAARRELPGEAHGFQQSSVLRPDRIAPAACHLIMAENDKRPPARRMLQPTGERVGLPRPVDRLDSICGDIVIAPPSIVRQDAPHELRLP
ncbi:MAG TPA: hypothetical protein VGN97_04645 [Mesorhizobium sp.]|jgi:hypothetical protein|nr:hypothetical protein [Mesorhizobium sp.]